MSGVTSELASILAKRRQWETMVEASLSPSLSSGTPAGPNIAEIRKKFETPQQLRGAWPEAPRGPHVPTFSFERSPTKPVSSAHSVATPKVDSKPTPPPLPPPRSSGSDAKLTTRMAPPVPIRSPERQSPLKLVSTSPAKLENSIGTRVAPPVPVRRPPLNIGPLIPSSPLKVGPSIPSPPLKIGSSTPSPPIPPRPTISGISLSRTRAPSDEKKGSDYHSDELTGSLAQVQENNGKTRAPPPVPDRQKYTTSMIAQGSVRKMIEERNNMISKNQQVKRVFYPTSSTITVGEEDYKAALHYFKAVFELVSTEFRFYVDLCIVNEIFIQSLEKKFGAEFIQKIFSNWRDLLSDHENLLCRLANDDRILKMTNLVHTPEKARPYSGLASNERMRSVGMRLEYFEKMMEMSLSPPKQGISPSSTADLMDKIRSVDGMAQYFSSVLVGFEVRLKGTDGYIANYQSAIQFIESLSVTKSHPAQALLLELEKDSFLKGLRLRDYLIKPIQRICKYPLLLREMIKHTKSHEAKKSLEGCYHMLLEVADHVNTMIHKSDEDFNAKIEDLKQHLKPSEAEQFGLTEQDCELLRIGEIKVIGASRSSLPKGLTLNEKFVGYLFSDRLLFVSNNTTTTTKHKYKILYALDFYAFIVEQKRKMEITRLEGNGDFCIMLNDPSIDSILSEIKWTFSVTDRTTLDGWISDLENIAQQCSETQILSPSAPSRKAVSPKKFAMSFFR